MWPPVGAAGRERDIRGEARQSPDCVAGLIEQVLRVCDGTGGTWVHIQCVMAEVVESEVAQVKVGVASVYCTREVGKAVDQANGIKGVAKSGREAARHFEKLAQTVIETHLVQAWDVCVGYVYEGLQRLGEVLHVADDRLKEAREQARDVQLHILEGNTQIAVRRINRGIRRDIAEVIFSFRKGAETVRSLLVSAFRPE